jgi:Ca2+/H+ antiporter
MQYLLRLVIAAVVFVVVILLIIPALFSILGMPASGAIQALIKGAAIISACIYILWGPTIPKPGT